jgi:hypothetical protein
MFFIINTANSYKKIDPNIGFQEKNATFSTKIGKKPWKIVIITSTPDRQEIAKKTSNM